MYTKSFWNSFLQTLVSAGAETHSVLAPRLVNEPSPEDSVVDKTSSRAADVAKKNSKTILLVLILKFVFQKENPLVVSNTADCTSSFDIDSESAPVCTNNVSDGITL